MERAPVYLDRLSVASALSLAFSSSRRDACFVLLGETASGRRASALLRRAGLLAAAPKVLSFHLEDVRDRRGESQFYHITERVTALAREISGRELDERAFLRALRRSVPEWSLGVYADKVIADEIREVVTLTAVVAWHAAGRPGEPVLLAARTRWTRRIGQEGAKAGVRLSSYVDWPGSTVRRVLRRFLRPRIGGAATTTASSRVSPARVEPFVRHPGAGGLVVAGLYAGRPLVVDDATRTEFYWLLRSTVPPERVLLYFSRGGVRPPAEAPDQLRALGVDAVSLDGGAGLPIEGWRPGPRYALSAGAGAVTVAMCAVKALLTSGHVTAGWGLHALYFFERRAWWREFFRGNKVGIDIDPYDFSKEGVAKHLALSDVGGLSVSIQWSNIGFASTFQASAADVMFSFGPAYDPIWRANGTRSELVLHSGYVTDYAIASVRDDARAIRSKLEAAGARYVVCYFDENSSEDPMSIITDEKCAGQYEAFLRRVLEDPTFGVVFKPSYPQTIYRRIARLEGLMAEAKATGRCVFLDGGDFKSTVYPTLAAQASDLVVGLLLSGTVALESWASGVPTAFLDVEHLESEPVYSWGRGSVVFQSTGELFSAIDSWRADPDSVPGFGDLSRWAEPRDPFRDGNAVRRIGGSLDLLLQQIDAGATPAEALDTLAERYSAEWGSEHVLRMRGSAEEAEAQ